MKKLLLTWIGTADLNASLTRGQNAVSGPIASALAALTFDGVILLFNPTERFSTEKYQAFYEWLKTQTAAPVELHRADLSRPTHYEEIYRVAVKTIDTALQKHGAKSKLTFHLSPGTSAMTAVWIILAKTRFQAQLIESSIEEGVNQVTVPFEIAAEFIPDLLREADLELRQRTFAPQAPEFRTIIHRSKTIKRLLDQAGRVAVRNVPVLIEGESGTGKELLARAIHQASPRQSKAFVAVNCGAIPFELVESELFGHEKGSFTGAFNARTGYFEEADGGTLFLDEVGELPVSAQVKLLRVLQEGEVTRVGASHPKKVDVRVISATNRNLLDEIAKGRFREDLFYRLAVIVLHIPPLRERDGDLSILIDSIWERLNEDALKLGIETKKLSVAAKNVLLQYRWTGNVRELQNTLTRLAITSEGQAVSREEAEAALLESPGHTTERVLNRPLTADFSLSEVIGEVSRHYLERALVETHGNKTAAAKLLGMANYQTLKNWLKKYDNGEP